MTQNGSVDAQLILPNEDGACVCETDSGDILISIPDSIGVQIKLETGEGSIILEDIFAELEDADPQDNIFEATLNSGSGTVNVKTDKGNIHLRTL